MTLNEILGLEGEGRVMKAGQRQALCQSCSGPGGGRSEKAGW